MVFEQARRRQRRRRQIVATASAGLLTIGLGSTALLGGFTTTGPPMRNITGFQVVNATIRPHVTYAALATYIVDHQMLSHLTYGAADGGEFFFYGTQRQALRLEGRLRSSQLFGVITVQTLRESTWLHMKGGPDLRNGMLVP